MKIKVFFTPRQTAKGNTSFSPSAGKPSLAVEQWLSIHGDKLKVVEPEKLSVADISLAHRKTYVEGVLSRRGINGFGNTSSEVANSLPWTTGSFYSAAKEAVTSGGVAVSPTSGFHHACWGHGGAFCTFNGLMIAALKLKREGFVNKVGILDLDEHYGNGTDDIIDTLNVDFVSHFTGGKYYHNAAESDLFLEGLPKILEEYFSDVDVLLYQAGADPHINDPLGGWLNDEQLRRRDRIVFEFCKKHDIPVAWNLAGGYQKDDDGSIQKVLDIHNATMDECVKIFGGENE